MRARSEPVRAFSTKMKPSDLRVASLAGTTRCTTSTRKFGPPRNEIPGTKHRAPVPQLLKKHSVLLIDERSKSYTNPPSG